MGLTSSGVSCGDWVMDESFRWVWRLNIETTRGHFFLVYAPLIVLCLVGECSVAPHSQGAWWSRDSRLLEWIFTLSSQYWLQIIILLIMMYLLCWDGNNLIKNIYENIIVWGEIWTEKWIVYIWKDGNCGCILTHKTYVNFTWIIWMIYTLMQIIPVMIRQLKINLQVKSDPLIYRKSVNIQSSYWHLL